MGLVYLWVLVTVLVMYLMTVANVMVNHILLIVMVDHVHEFLI